MNCELSILLYTISNGKMSLTLYRHLHFEATHNTHTHTYIYIYVYIYVWCMYLCVCVFSMPWLTKLVNCCQYANTCSKTSLNKEIINWAPTVLTKLGDKPRFIIISVFMHVYMYMYSFSDFEESKTCRAYCLGSATAVSRYSVAFIDRTVATVAATDRRKAH